MQKDLHNNIKVSRAIAPAAAVANNTPFVSSILDTYGFDASEFLAQFGAVGNGTFTALVEDGNDPALADAATVDPSQLLGAVTPFAPTANQAWKIGYVGVKRYVRVTITPAGNSANIFLSAVWTQYSPRRFAQTSPQFV